MRSHIVLPFLLFILLAQLCAGLSVYPSKKTIQELFKTSIKLELRKQIQVGNNAWTACNQDSTFFTRDTVVFDNSNSITCCATVQWTFYRMDAFVQNLAQTCKEPSSATVIKVEDFYIVELIDEHTSVVMRTNNRAGKQISFRVINVDKESRSIKRVRITQENS